MVCEPYKEKLDTYLDGELSEAEMRSFDGHVRSCLVCSAEALGRVQMKRAIQAAGKRFSPTAEFQERIRRSVISKPKRTFGLSGLRPAWMLPVAAIVVLAFGLFVSNYLSSRSNRNHIYGEIADLHVATLASSTPVDVVSTDRHTVKPWFQGKIPFAFNLPELQNTGFTLLGGRMTYLDQNPGAQLIYDVGKHHISVFIFQNRNLPPNLGSSRPTGISFNMESWDQNGLRFFVVSDASGDDVHRLAQLFRR
jgi:anti-sigma factor RsiW